MEEETWGCVFSSDPPSKKRKRWTDGILVLRNNSLQLRGAESVHPLGSSAAANISEDDEIKVGRYTVQVGAKESSGSSSSNNISSRDDRASAVSGRGDLFDRKRSTRILPHIHRSGEGVPRKENENKSKDGMPPAPIAGNGTMMAAPPEHDGRGLNTPPSAAAVSTDKPIVHGYVRVVKKFKAPARLGQVSRAGFIPVEPEPSPLPPGYRYQGANGSGASQAKDGVRGARPFSVPRQRFISTSADDSTPEEGSDVRPSSGVTTPELQQPQQRQKEPVGEYHGMSPSTSSTRGKMRPDAGTLHRRPLLVPRSPAYPCLSPSSSPSSRSMAPRNIRSTAYGTAADNGARTSSNKQQNKISTPPFKLMFGAGQGAGASLAEPVACAQASTPAPQQPEHNQENSGGRGGGAEESSGKSPSSATANAKQTLHGPTRATAPAKGAAGRWPTRTAWIPNAFPSPIAYQSAFALAMQEELQLVLDEAVVARYAKADANISRDNPKEPRADRRDPLWRQKHIRREGVHFYSSVSVFRAGSNTRESGPAKKKSGDWRRAGGSGGRGGRGSKKRQRGWSSDGYGTNDNKDGESSESGSSSTGKLYLKILNLSESKEPGAAYGKGDVWAFSADGRFSEAGNAVFCRSCWSGVSSQGMISIEPLGDESEALRLESTAGRGGGRNARTVFAIRCFNAQTDLAALDLLRKGYLEDDRGDAPISTNMVSPDARRVDSIPILRYLLSGGGSQNEGSAMMTGFDTRGARIEGPRPVRPSGRIDIHNIDDDDSDEKFRLCLTRHQLDAEVTKTIKTFFLNTDQARLLWRCAAWFRPAPSVDRGARERRGTLGEETGRKERDDRRKHEKEQAAPPVVLVHGVFGAGKSLSLVALCVMLDGIVSADAQRRSSRGLPTRKREEQIRILLAAGTNVAVDRVLMGLVKVEFTDIARVGSHRRVHKSLLEYVVHSAPGRDAKQTAQNDLQEMLKTSVGDERDTVSSALEAAKKDTFVGDQARRLREARVTGVTCASSTLPLLKRSAARASGGGAKVSMGIRPKVAGLGGVAVKGSGGLRTMGSSGTGRGRGTAEGYDIVLLDECSQIVEPISLLPLAVAQCSRLVLVGDPMQLPPAVAHAKACIAPSPTSALSVRAESPPLPYARQGTATLPVNDRTQSLAQANAARTNGDTLEKTLFVRLARLPGMTPLLLGQQYRCHPTLSGLANRLFYDGRLSDGICATDRPPLVPGLAPLTLVDAVGRGQEAVAAGGSICNLFEAQAVANLVSRLLRDGGGRDDESPALTASSIGVICLYKAQLVEVRRQLESASTASSSSNTSATAGSTAAQGRVRGDAGDASLAPRDVQVSTVDAFQGAEKDVVIVASTRTDRLGFIVSPQRLCVALTRARHHLIVVGEKRVLVTNPLWREIVAASAVSTS